MQLRRVVLVLMKQKIMPTAVLVATHIKHFLHSAHQDQYSAHQGKYSAQDRYSQTRYIKSPYKRHLQPTSLQIQLFC